MTDDVIALWPRVMSVAYRTLGSVADSEDAVQTVALAERSRSAQG